VRPLPWRSAAQALGFTGIYCPGPIETILSSSNHVPAVGSYVWVRPAVGLHKSFYITHTEADSVVVLSPYCTHLGCQVKWVELNHRFECPCHYQTYELNGNYINGVAPRSMDRFPFTITYTDGTSETASATGDPIPVNGREIASITIDTRWLIQRAGRT
jgi:Rieske Fe-S protein